MKIIITLFSFIIIQTTSYSQNYPKIFGDDYKNAVNYFKTNKQKLSKSFNIYNIDLKIATSVVFPERIRYSIVKDFFETAYLEVFYVENGSKQVDFSIGDFQIKPSFAEKVEFFVKYNQKLKLKYKILSYYNDTNIKSIRKKRVSRLKKTYYQIIYISAFYDIVKTKFSVNNMSKKEQIKFFATAYNYGFDKTQTNLTKRINTKSFPYGSTYPGKQYSYSNISYYFYFNEFCSIFNQ